MLMGTGVVVNRKSDVAGWSATRLFDYIEENLGIGDFAGEPQEYRAWRMGQVGRMKRLLTYRHVSNLEMKACADYCKAHRIQPESLAGLLRHIHDAMKWQRNRLREQKDLDFDEILAQEQERALSDEEASRWVDMLLRASKSRREEVLTKWRQERALSSSSPTK
jgi:hypothetical protein